MANIIDGKAIAEKILGSIRERVLALQGKKITPCLAVILVGDNPASISYINSKEKALSNAGMKGKDIRLPASTQEEELISLINNLNKESEVHSILVQLPLPAHIDEEKITSAIDPAKDADGFHPVSAGNLLLGRKGFLPCTPHGIIRLLEETKIPIAGAHAVVVGRSNTVGKPLAILLAEKKCNATVTLCHTGTKDLPAYTSQADILIAAVGKPNLVNAAMVKQGAVVIDVGINRVEDSTRKKGYKISGDVDFEAVAEKAAWITPVPGGVGPMTIAMLLENVVLAAELSAGKTR